MRAKGEKLQPSEALKQKLLAAAKAKSAPERRDPSLVRGLGFRCKKHGKMAISMGKHMENTWKTLEKTMLPLSEP